MGNFSCLSGSLITAPCEHSDPVPAVVTTAKSGGGGLLNFLKPRILGTDFSGLLILAPMILAQSMGEPPPKAMMLSQ
jgi:hypothetical protein